METVRIIRLRNFVSRALSLCHFSISASMSGLRLGPEELDFFSFY